MNFRSSQNQRSYKIFLVKREVREKKNSAFTLGHHKEKNMIKETIIDVFLILSEAVHALALNYVLKKKN